MDKLWRYIGITIYKISGKTFLNGSFRWKIWRNGTNEKLVPFSRLEFSKLKFLGLFKWSQSLPGLLVTGFITLSISCSELRKRNTALSNGISQSEDLCTSWSVFPCKWQTAIVYWSCVMLNVKSGVTAAVTCHFKALPLSEKCGYWHGHAVAKTTLPLVIF